METTHNDDDFKTESWVYAGRRWTNGGKVTHEFHDPDAETVFFDKAPRGPIIGGCYDIEVKRGDGDRITARLRSATYTGTVGGAAPVADWRLEDRAAANAQEAQRAARRARSDNTDFGDLNLREIKVMLASAPSPIRYGMLTAVMEYLR